MPLIEAQYASEDGHRTARLYRTKSGQWRVVRWEWWEQTATEITYPSEGHASRADAEQSAEAWVERGRAPTAHERNVEAHRCDGR